MQFSGQIVCLVGEKQGLLVVICYFIIWEQRGKKICLGLFLVIQQVGGQFGVYKILDRGENRRVGKREEGGREGKKEGGQRKGRGGEGEGGREVFVIGDFSLYRYKLNYGNQLWVFLGLILIGVSLWTFYKLILVLGVFVILFLLEFSYVGLFIDYGYFKVKDRIEV